MIRRVKQQQTTRLFKAECESFCGRMTFMARCTQEVTLQGETFHFQRLQENTVVHKPTMQQKQSLHVDSLINAATLNLLTNIYSMLVWDVWGCFSMFESTECVHGVHVSLPRFRILSLQSLHCQLSCNC